MKHFLFLAIVLLVLAACSDDGHETVRPPGIRLVLTPGETLGDQSYNDDLMNGIRSVATPEGLAVTVVSPVSVAAGEDSIAHWLSHPDQRTFTVLSSNSLLDYLNGNPPAKFHSNILQLDVAEAAGGNIPACSFRGYGCAFLAGVAAYEMTKSGRAAYVGGQSGHEYLVDCERGFTDGFLFAGGKEVTVRYLSDNGDGFSMSDEAYRLAGELYADHPFILMLAGGSNLGLYKYLNEHPDEKFYTAGVDIDQSALSPHIVGSLVKETGKCVAGYLTRWLAGKETPASQVFGLSSGYIRFAIAPGYEERLEEVIQKNLPAAKEREGE